MDEVQPGPPEQPWTLDEVAEYYREDTRTTRRRVKRGELNPVRLPGSRRMLFNPAEVRGKVGFGSVAS
jgi:hypothetical protein